MLSMLALTVDSFHACWVSCKSMQKLFTSTVKANMHLRRAITKICHLTLQTLVEQIRAREEAHCAEPMPMLQTIW